MVQSGSPFLIKLASSHGVHQSQQLVNGYAS